MDHRLIANIDIAPTIFQATSITPNYPLDGHSLLGRYQRKWLLLEFPAGARAITPWWSYLSGRRQYIVWGDGWREDYDLGSDPWEMNATTVDHPGLDAAIAKARTCSGTGCP